jgi:hypothetical protein
MKRFVAEISNKLAASERFFTGRLATRLTKAAEQHPQDHTIVQMASFLSRRAGAPGGHLISRAELHEIYNKLHTSNTKAAAYLGDELGVKAHNLPKEAPMTRSPREGESIDDLYSRHADQRLVSEFESAFNKNAVYKPFDPRLAKRAESVVAGVLPGQPVVQAVDGREYAILCQATYETPRGRSSVLIPVEVVNGNALVPSVFLTPAGFENLTHQHVVAHLERTAGKFFRVNANQVFDIIKKTKFGTTDEAKVSALLGGKKVATDELDQVDRAVMALKAKTGGNEVTAEGILYQRVDPETKGVELPESPATRKFADQLSSVDGQAEFVFGQKAVDMGRYWIQKELSSFGYDSPQVKVANIADDSIVYAVSVAGTGFKVPVKVKDKKALQPSMILTAGGVEEFSRAGIKNAMGASDMTASALAMGYDVADPAGLIKEVEACCNVGDLKRAGEALAALNSTGDERAMQYASGVYFNALEGGQPKQASPKMKTIKVGGNVVEATTGLPVDKVYVDENGQVQAKYRQHMDKTDEGTAGGFMNAKIIMGM